MLVLAQRFPTKAQGLFTHTLSSAVPEGAIMGQSPGSHKHLLLSAGQGCGSEPVLSADQYCRVGSDRAGGCFLLVQRCATVQLHEGTRCPSCQCQCWALYSTGVGQHKVVWGWKS